MLNVEIVKDYGTQMAALEGAGSLGGVVDFDASVDVAGAFASTGHSGQLWIMQSTWTNTQDCFRNHTCTVRLSNYLLT
jgi:hypothetical protein